MLKKTFALLLCVGLLAAFSPGDSAYTKRKETFLRGEPSLSGSKVATLKWGQKVKILQSKGRWLEVKASKKGWVFGGALSSKKPPSNNKNDFLATSASETTASIAARGLHDGAIKYGARHSYGTAVSDVQWMEKQSDAITDSTLRNFMKEKKLGEYAQ